MKLQKQKTLVLIKPDGVQRSLIGEIISRFEKVGLKIIGLKIFVPTKEQIEQQYGPSKQEVEAMGKRSIEAQVKLGKKIELLPYEYGMKIFNWIEKYISSGPVVGIVLQGNYAVELVKKLVGITEPLNSDVGTIRGDYTLDSYELANNDGRAVRNAIHRSASLEEAEKEIAIWFKPEEILNYKLISERILYDVNLDGILE
ncbi:MAG: nucleoside-diphosphate kinase [Candidatus Pacebacteria bacterium]|nr:nucleoside-diphosphate kinase [Candidatus Paceibacterota bacterium]